MTLEHFELFYILQNEQMTFEERYNAAREIGGESLMKKFEPEDIPVLYKAAVNFWKSMDMSEKDSQDAKLFDIRRKLANVCWRLSIQLPEGQKFFKCFPRVKIAEGFEGRRYNKLIRGSIKPVYGTSLYEFHWEYPIEGFGIKKDLISVVTEDNQRIPIMDWCRQNDFIVYCNRCGQDITSEVSRNCPFNQLRYRKRTK